MLCQDGTGYEQSLIYLFLRLSSNYFYKDLDFENQHHETKNQYISLYITIFSVLQ